MGDLLYEIGKKDGLSKDQIRADITATLAITTHSEFGHLPPELKYIITGTYSTHSEQRKRIYK